jgi:hypothetical protein
MTQKLSFSPKLGVVGSAPVVPFMPVSAQVATAYHATLHLKFDQSDAYVTAHLPSIPPSRIKAAIAAVSQCEKELSWSGRGATYYALTVVPEPKASRARLEAKGVLLGYVFVVPGTEIVSADEPLTAQVDDGEEGDPDTDTDGDDMGPLLS